MMTMKNEINNKKGVTAKSGVHLSFMKGGKNIW